MKKRTIVLFGIGVLIVWFGKPLVRLLDDTVYFTFGQLNGYPATKQDLPKSASD